MPPLEQGGEALGPLGALTHDDARRVQVVIQRPAFAQKLGREHQIVATESLPQRFGIAHGNGGLDHHDGRRIDGHHILDHRLNRTGVEVMGIGIVIGRRRYDDEIRPLISLMLVQRCRQIERLVREIVLQLGISDGGFPLIDQRDLLRHQVQRNNLVMLREQHGIGQTDIAGARYSNFHYI